MLNSNNSIKNIELLSLVSKDSETLSQLFRNIKNFKK